MCNGILYWVNFFNIVGICCRLVCCCVKIVCEVWFVGVLSVLLMINCWLVMLIVVSFCVVCVVLSNEVFCGCVININVVKFLLFNVVIVFV